MTIENKKLKLDKECKLIITEKNQLFMNPKKMVDPLSDDFLNCFNHFIYDELVGNSLILLGQDGIIYNINVKKWKIEWFFNLNYYLKTKKDVWILYETITKLEIKKDNILFLIDNSLLFNIDLNSGKIKWRKKIEEDLSHFRIYVDNNITIITKTKYFIFSFKNGEELSKTEYYSSDFFINSKLVLRLLEDTPILFSPLENRKINDIEDGYEILKKDNIRQVLEFNGIIYIFLSIKDSINAKYLIAYNINGKKLWRKKFKITHIEYEGLNEPFEISSKGFSCYDSLGNFYLFDLKSGKNKFVANIGKKYRDRRTYYNRYSSPIYKDGMIIIGKEEHTRKNLNNIYEVFNLKNGNFIYKFEAVSNPVIYKNRLFIFHRKFLDNEELSITLRTVYPIEKIQKKYSKKFDSGHNIKKLLAGNNLIFFYTNLIICNIPLENLEEALMNGDDFLEYQVFEKLPL